MAPVWMPDDLHSIDPAAMWISGVGAADESAWIQYEFDKVYSLDQMLVWNHNTMVEHLVGFGIKEATIEYSLDGIDDYVETPLSDVPKDGTVEAWFKTTSDAREAIFSSHGGDQEFRVHLNYRLGKGGSTGSLFSTLVYYCPEDRKEDVR